MQRYAVLVLMVCGKPLHHRIANRRSGRLGMQGRLVVFAAPQRPAPGGGTLVTLRLQRGPAAAPDFGMPAQWLRPQALPATEPASGPAIEDLPQASHVRPALCRQDVMW